MVQETLSEMYLSNDGAVRMVFVFSTPASRENNPSHYRHLWRDSGRPVVGLQLFRSLGRSA